MYISKKLLSEIVQNYIANNLAEGRRQREQLFKKAPGLETIYLWYKEKTPEGKLDNPRIDDTELRWILKNFKNIRQELDIHPDVDLVQNKMPIAPKSIDTIVMKIVNFLQEKDNLGQAFKQYRKNLSSEELENNNILGPDINQYKSLKDLDMATSHVETKTSILGSDMLETSISLGTFNGYEMTVPQDVRASVEFDSDPKFKTTTWCTTRREGQNLFDNYTLRGGILFYFKKTSVSDEKASEKTIAGSYKDPFTRFCIGLDKGSTEPSFPAEGKGHGGLIVNQNNDGITEEKAREVLGDDFDSAIEAIKKYNEQTDNQLPFAKNFFRIVKSIRAVKETIQDWTWPEKYDFLVNQDNPNSIMRLSDSSLPDEEQPGTLVVQYALKFKKDFDRDMQKILDAQSGTKAAKFCYYGISKFKRPAICRDIINKKLLQESDETIDTFFDLVIDNPSLAYFSENGISEQLSKKYIKSKVFNEALTNITNFSDWLASSDEIFSDYYSAAQNILSRLEKSKCLVAKEALSSQTKSISFDTINSAFIEIVEDLSQEENVDASLLQSFLKEYEKLIASNEKLGGSESSNEEEQKKIVEACVKGLNSLILGPISRKIRYLSQQLEAESFASISKSLLSNGVEGVYKKAFKIFDSQNLLPEIDELALFKLSSKNQKESIEKSLSRSFFVDVVLDNDPLNLQKFGRICNSDPDGFLSLLMYIKEPSEKMVELIIQKLFEEMKQNNATHIQDFFTTKGKIHSAWSNILARQAIPKLYKEKDIDTEVSSNFIKNISKNFTNQSSDDYSLVVSFLASYGLKLVKDFDGAYQIFINILNDASQAGNAKDDFDRRTSKDYSLESFLDDYVRNGMSLNQLFERLVEEKVVLHNKDYNAISKMTKRDSFDLSSSLATFARYVANNLERIERTITFGMTSYSRNLKFGLDDFKKIYSALDGQRLSFFIFPSFSYNISADPKSFASILKMIDQSFAKKASEYSSEADDDVAFISQSIPIAVSAVADQIPLVAKYLIATNERYSYMYEIFMKSLQDTNPSAYQRIANAVAEQLEIADKSSQTLSQSTTDSDGSAKDQSIAKQTDNDF